VAVKEPPTRPKFPQLCETSPFQAENLKETVKTGAGCAGLTAGSDLGIKLIDLLEALRYTRFPFWES
jgi:hypothetical protein